MNKFIGYTTYDNEDPAILSYEEYKAQSLPDDWAEYVWIRATDRTEARARYQDCMDEYEADNKSCRPIKDVY